MRLWALKLEYKHCNGKKTKLRGRGAGGRGQGAGGGLRIWYVQGYWRNSKWIFQVLIKNNVEFSRRNQEINCVEFPGIDLRP